MIAASRLEPGNHVLAARGIRPRQRTRDRFRHGAKRGRLRLFPRDDAGGVFALGRDGRFTQFGHAERLQLYARVAGGRKGRGGNRKGRSARACG